MVRAMHLRRTEHQIGERRRVDTFDFLDGPVVPGRGHQSFMLTGYTKGVRMLVVIVLLLAVFGASIQCVADCLPQPNLPPCHQHSQKHSPKNDPCKHGQLVAVTHAASDQPVDSVTHLAQVADAAETASNLPARLLTILRI
jgi:hypothetical protein